MGQTAPLEFAGALGPEYRENLDFPAPGGAISGASPTVHALTFNLDRSEGPIEVQRLIRDGLPLPLTGSRGRTLMIGSPLFQQMHRAEAKEVEFALRRSFLKVDSDTR